MAGIVSYGAYIPKYRIDRKVLYKAMGWLNPATFMPGEKAVANFDEDSLSMAVAAGVDCLRGIGREVVDAAFFATSTAPYSERQNSVIMATALDFRSDIRTADFTDAVKSGTTAVLSAIDAVKAGSAKNVIVCASDIRVGKAGGAQEEIFGDGAASVLIGQDDLAAKFLGSSSVSYDFVDHWRAKGDQFDRQWEDRFIRDVGYAGFIIEAMTNLAKECSIKLSDVAKVSYPCLYMGDFKKIAAKLGLSPEQVVEPLIGQVGYTGTADPMMHLVKALENAKPGDKIAVASFGSGSDAMLFEVTDKNEQIKGGRRAVSKNLAAKRALDNYEKMVAFRNILPTEKGIRGDQVAFTPLSELWRSRRQILALYGSRCKACGTPQFPPQRVCVNPKCGAIDQMEPYRFSDKRGTLASYTGDNLAFSPNPPAIYSTVNFDGGGRYWFDVTDVDLENVEVKMTVEMSFRRKYVDDKFGVHGYFWKAVPVLD